MGHWTPTGVEPKDYDDDDDVCTQTFQCATFYQQSSIFRMTCKKYAEGTFFKGKFTHTPSFLVCAHLTTCVRTTAHSLEGTLITTHCPPIYSIELVLWESYLIKPIDLPLHALL